MKWFIGFMFAVIATGCGHHQRAENEINSLKQIAYRYKNESGMRSLLTFTIHKTGPVQVSISEAESSFGELIDKTFFYAEREDFKYLLSLLNKQEVAQYSYLPSDSEGKRSSNCYEILRREKKGNLNYCIPRDQATGYALELVGFFAYLLEIKD